MGKSVSVMRCKNVSGLAVIILLLVGMVFTPLPTVLNSSRVLAADAPEADWDQTFGQTGDDAGFSVQPTDDGGYIMVGSTTSYGAGSSDVWLIKTDGDGNKVWSQTFGGSKEDIGRSVQQTSDGGYIITGNTESYGAGASDVWLIKTEVDGTLVWSQTFGAAGNDVGQSVQQTTPDGGYIIAGHTYSYGIGSSDIWLIKTNASGTKTWDRTFGSTGSDAGFSVQQTTDSGYILTGNTAWGAGSSDLWLIKTDANGNSLWTDTTWNQPGKIFGGSGWDSGNSVQQIDGGGYIVTGYTESYGAGASDVWLIKTDANGDVATGWTDPDTSQVGKTFGGAGWDSGRSVLEIEGGYIIAGYTISFGGAGLYDAWMIKTDTNGNQDWSQTFGGSDDDVARAVQQTSDGYILTGYTKSYGDGSSDAWLIKTDSGGGQQWNKTFGGSGNDAGFSVQQTAEGGYIIAGYTYSGGDNTYDAWLIKTNPSGDEQWSQTFGSTGDDSGQSVQQTSDGGYIIAGYTYSDGDGSSDAWLIKTNANGVEQWSQTFGSTGDDVGQSVQQTADGGYILTGSTADGTGSTDAWLIKTNGTGVEQWSKTFGSTGDDAGQFVQQTADGGYIITGNTASGGGSSDAWLIKTNASGVEEWSQAFGGLGNDAGFSVQQTSDDGYIIAGYTASYGAGSSDVWLIKTNASGVEEWSQTFGGSANDTGRSVQQTSDDGYIIAGYTESYGAGMSDVWLIKTDASGVEEWSQTFGNARDDFGWSTQQTSDGGYIVAGYTASSGAGAYDAWLIKVSSTQMAPTISSVSPASGLQGETLSVTITGNYFTNDTSSVDFGSADITVEDFTVDSLTRITADITIDADAATGTTDVSVTTPAGTDTLTDGFIVEEALEPTISSVNPDSGLQGEAMSVTVTGTYLTQDASLNFGTGITVDNITKDSSTQLTADITIDADAATSLRDVSVTTLAGTGTMTDGFTVDPAQDPTISSVSPASGLQGETLSVTITGTNFTQDASLDFGSGITVDNITKDSSTQITADITIDADAATGSRDISITTIVGTDTMPDGFTINQALEPTISSVSPDSGLPGEALSVTITGTNFTGATSVSFGSGITVDSFKVDSPTQITAEITIAEDATLGKMDVAVTGPGGTYTHTEGFTIGETSGDGGGSSLWWLYLLIGLATVAVLVVLIIRLQKRGKSSSFNNFK